MCLFVILLLVAFGVLMSRNASSPQEELAQEASLYVSSVSTLASLFPSSLPTRCGETITLNAKKIDFQLHALKYPRVAVDGTSMIVLVRDFKTGNLYTQFYSLSASDEGVMINAFHQKFSAFGYQSVCISGTTAFVALWEYGTPAGMI